MGTTVIKATPFLKWAGGKSQLFEQFERFFPPTSTYDRYLEPFVGSGAVFFHLLPKRPFLNDNNKELMNCYRQVRDNVEDVIEFLKVHKRRHSKEFYYKIRSLNPENLSSAERAARLIYLNKTCYNGLYRENSKGQFNVPMGSYVNPTILEENTLRTAGIALKRAKVFSVPFEVFCEKYAKKGDFIYFDPPYFPLSRTSSFTSYTKNDFGYKDHEKLRGLFEELDKRGCLLMLSNSASPVVKELFKKYSSTTFEVLARRAINCIGTKRAHINELVILNYSPEPANRIEEFSSHKLFLPSKVSKGTARRASS